MGRRRYLQDEVPHAREPKARWRHGRQHQETCLDVLPAEERARPHRTVFALGEGPRHCPVGKAGSVSAPRNEIPRRRKRSRGRSWLSFVLSFVSSLVRVDFREGQAWAEGREMLALCRPALFAAGKRTVHMGYAPRHDLDRSHTSNE